MALTVLDGHLDGHSAVQPFGHFAYYTFTIIDYLCEGEGLPRTDPEITVLEGPGTGVGEVGQGMGGSQGARTQNRETGEFVPREAWK